MSGANYIIIPSEIVKSDLWRSLSSSEKLTLMALLFYANKEYKCFPSISTICNFSSQSKKTFLKNKKRLEELGLLSYDKGRTGKSNYYTISQTLQEVGAKSTLCPNDPMGRGNNAPEGGVNLPLSMGSNGTTKDKRTSNLKENRKIDGGADAPLLSTSSSNNIIDTNNKNPSTEISASCACNNSVESNLNNNNFETKSENSLSDIKASEACINSDVVLNTNTIETTINKPSDINTTNTSESSLINNTPPKNLLEKYKDAYISSYKETVGHAPGDRFDKNGKKWSPQIEQLDRELKDKGIKPEEYMEWAVEEASYRHDKNSDYKIQFGSIISTSLYSDYLESDEYYEKEKSAKWRQIVHDDVISRAITLYRKTSDKEFGEIFLQFNDDEISFNELRTQLEKYEKKFEAEIRNLSNLAHERDEKEHTHKYSSIMYYYRIYRKETLQELKDAICA